MTAALPLILGGSAAWAADTVETWEPGAGNVDCYLGVSGLGDAGGRSAALGAEGLVGLGLTEAFSLFLGFELSALGEAGGAEPALSVGAFGTVLDTSHVDVDLFLELAAGPMGEAPVLAASFELNLDERAERETAGVYLRGGAHFPLGPGTVSAQFEPGAYWTVRSGQQLFLEAELVGGEIALERLAAGMNVMLSDELELVTELGLGDPLSGETRSFRALAGFIATISPHP